MDYKKIFTQAYEAMDISIIDGNCGALCSGHCCRSTMENGEALGIYFLPFEYEAMQAGNGLVDPTSLEIHRKYDFELPQGIDQMTYGFCKDINNCIRALRPIQCRTYPFEPHLENGVLSLVIEMEQVHECPLLSQKETWNPLFKMGISKGWKILLQIPEIRILVEAQSEERRYLHGKSL